MQYNANAKRPNYVLPKGEYPAKIYEAEEKLSKAGNPMLVVSLEVYDQDRMKLIKDYIVTGGEHSQDWKIGHLAESCGLENNGSIDAAQLVDRNVRVKVKIKPAKDGYQEDNAIDDYIAKQAGDSTKAEVATRAPSKPASASQAELDNSDVPF